MTISVLVAPQVFSNDPHIQTFTTQMVLFKPFNQWLPKSKFMPLYPQQTHSSSQSYPRQKK